MSSLRLSRRALLVAGSAGAVALSFGLPRAGTLRLGGWQANAFVHIDASGQVTLVNPAIELGQGSSTALAQIVADALDADWARVKVIPAPYDDAFGNPHFGGRLVTADSAATQAFWPILRQAGEQARAILVFNAARRWQLDPQALRTEAGAVLHPDGRRLSYGDLAAQVRLPGALESLPKLAPREAHAGALVGQALARVDLADKLAGRAVYGVDARSAPAAVVLLLAPDALGATVAELDDRAARAIPGVQEVLRLPAFSNAVAVIAADTWSALQGREALRVRWQAPPEPYDSEAALQGFAAVARAGAADAHIVRQQGDADAALASSSRTIRREWLSRHVTHAALEPLNAQASPRWLGQGADLVASTQAPSLDMRRAAQSAKRPPQGFKVASTLVGGAYGRRVDNDGAGAAAWLAQKLGRAVQVLQFVGDDIAHGQVRTISAQALEVGLDARHRITCWHHRSVGSSTLARMFPDRFAKEKRDKTLIDGQEHGYDIAHQRIESIHRPLPVACGFLRGVAAGFHVFAIESIVDEAAALARADPLAYRLALLSDVRARRVVEHLGSLKRTAAPGVAHGFAFMSLRGSHVALCATCRLDARGAARVEHLQFALDCGRVINPTLVRCQVEGAALMGLSIALQERLDFVDGRAVQRSLAQYPVLRAHQAPRIDVDLIHGTDGEPRGVGEIALPLVAPGVANAMAQLTGSRLRDLPFTF